MDVDHHQISWLDLAGRGQSVGDVGARAGGNVGARKPLSASAAHCVLGLGRDLALGRSGLDGLDRRCHSGVSDFGGSVNALNLLRFLDHAQLGQHMGAVLDLDLRRLGMRVSKHPHHRLREEGVFEAHRPFLDTEVLEVVGDRVDHPDFVFESGDRVEKGKLPYVLHVRRRDPQSDLAFVRYQGIGAKSAVAGEIEHVCRLGEEQGVEPSFMHETATSGEAL